jgi:hypothetical protein
MTSSGLTLRYSFTYGQIIYGKINNSIVDIFLVDIIMPCFMPFKSVALNVCPPYIVGVRYENKGTLREMYAKP